MERTLITWNLPNWGTVFLMAIAGYAALAVIAQIAMRAGLMSDQGG